MKIMEGQVTLRRTIEGHGTPLRVIEGHGGPWNTIEGHRITLKPLKAMKGHLIPWRVMCNAIDVPVSNRTVNECLLRRDHGWIRRT